MDSSTFAPPTSPPYERPTHERAVSSLSHVSNRSRRSSGSGVAKPDLTEHSKEKRRLHTKADPSMAINEAQPAAVAQQASNLEDLRDFFHKDMDGNVISDPDRSNPTRHRLERPLDTIRAFQAAAEGTSNNRRSTYTASRPASSVGSHFDGGQNRRGSYYGAGMYAPSPQRPRPGAGGYYRNSAYFRPDSFAEDGPATTQYPPRGGGMRYSSAPSYYGQPAEVPSPSHSHQQSYETMTSGSDDNNKSTNPSSQNSSFDRLHQLQKQQEPQMSSEYDSGYAPANPPRSNGMMYDSPTIQMQQQRQHEQQQFQGMEYNGFGNNGGYPGSYPQQSQQQQVHQPLQHRGPMAPAQGQGPNNPRVPIKLNSGNGPPPSSEDWGSDLKNSGSPKRGWLKRAFSKKG